MKKALLCVSFGTSVAAARESITAVEEVLRSAAPDRLFARAFTSPTIRRILAGRGEEIPGVSEALEALCWEGMEDVLVQPTHVLYGHEYDSLRETLGLWRERFPRLELGRPLLADTDDMRTLAEILSRQYPACPGEALVLFGHGTDHFANAVYPAMQTAFRLMGREDILVGTVEGWPGYSDVERQLKVMGAEAVRLVPMMLVAGDHAMNDMSGDEDSWRTRLEAAGFRVDCVIRGLGMVPEVRELYRTHLAGLL